MKPPHGERCPDGSVARDGELSPHSQQWLAVSQLTPEHLLPEPTTPTVHLYYCDHLGTPIALINTQGGIDWRAEFDPWGNQVDGSNPQRLYQPIRMQGQHYDDESGMHYNRYRYYDPALGRYISQDPIGLRGGWNVYNYPLNPITMSDPLGLVFRVEGDRESFDSAIKYLKQDAEMNKIITALENDSKHTVVVSCNSEHDNSFNRLTMRIHWDPKSAIFCDSNAGLNGKFDFKNGTQVPAFGLGHEISHAHAFITEGYKDFVSRTRTPDPDYDDSEEKRVITGVETHAAKSLKQCVRKNHRGFSYHVQGPLEYL